MMKHLKGIGLAAVTVLCWSGYNIAAKYGIENGLSPEALTFLRFAVPGAIALPILIVFRLQAKHANIPLLQVVVLVFFGGPLFGLVAVSGYDHAPLSHGLLFAPVAVFVAGSFLGALLLNERVSTFRLIGAAIMFVGLAVLVGFELRDLGNTWHQGVMLFGLAGAMWGCYTVLLRLWRIPMIEGTIAVACGSALVAVPFLGVSAYETLTSVPTSSVILQIMMQGFFGGVVSVVALIGAVRVLPAQVVSLLPAATPVVALAIAGMALGQTPSAAELIGVVIVGSGFLLSFKTRVAKTEMSSGLVSLR
ncbi:MAG: DMT family transporter [Pseudomonadota bacterium]